VAGIGFAHVIRREFTCTELILERAEAELLTNDIDGCMEDIIAYETSRYNFSEATKNRFSSGLRLPADRARMESWYAASQAGSHSNVYDNWDFTQGVSPSFVVSASQVTYMNMINEMRRYETAWTGLRFFDIKRLGIPFVRTYGPTAITWELTAHDTRLAIELPSEVLLSGLESSRAQSSFTGGSSSEMKPSSFEMATNK
jgi:hypothetical protein